MRRRPHDRLENATSADECRDLREVRRLSRPVEATAWCESGHWLQQVDHVAASVELDAGRERSRSGRSESLSNVGPIRR